MSWMSIRTATVSKSSTAKVEEEYFVAEMLPVTISAFLSEYYSG